MLIAQSSCVSNKQVIEAQCATKELLLAPLKLFNHGKQSKTQETAMKIREIRLPTKQKAEFYCRIALRKITILGIGYYQD